MYEELFHLKLSSSSIYYIFLFFPFVVFRIPEEDSLESKHVEKIF
jgi:hypothetical protein